MERFVKGDLVIFPFPYTDLSNSKKRPCLVLSNEMSEDILLCQVTSKNSIKDQYVVELNKTDVSGGVLVIDSFIRSNMLFTVNKNQITGFIGKINSKKYSQVFDKVVKLIKK